MPGDAAPTGASLAPADAGHGQERWRTQDAQGNPGLEEGLLREWQGQTHHVTVVEGGFEYDGKVWRSLSAIARSITGTPWSGPAFFGLKA